MAGMGPAPNPNRQRRNASVSTLKLPASGRAGRAPAWPLLDDVALAARRDVHQAHAEKAHEDLEDHDLPLTLRGHIERRLEKAEFEAAVLTRQMAAQRDLEKRVWRELWRTPQSVAWERLGWTRDVAQYVRWKVLAELGDLDAAKEARQLSDRIGLTPLAMLRLRWEIVTDEEMARGTRVRPQRPASKGAERPPADPRAALYAVG